jgi:hypothetical protein
MLGALKKKGIKSLGFYWTLGLYDDVVIFEVSTEKDAMKLTFDVREDVTTETLVAIPREEGVGGLNFNTGMPCLLVVGLWLTIALLIQHSNQKG